MQEDNHYRVIRLVDSQLEISQRELVAQLGVSLGKANYCLRALIEKGRIEARNFRNSNDKSAYNYLLTRRGMKEKARLATRFLKRKLTEYEEFKEEIVKLQCEVGDPSADGN